MKSRNECCNLSIGLYIALAPLSLNYAGKLQEKRFDFIKTLANIISENLVEVSKIKYFKPNQQTLLNQIRISWLSRIIEGVCYVGRHTLYIFLYHNLFLEYFLSPYVMIENIWLRRVVFLIVMIGGSLMVEKLLTRLASMIKKLYDNGELQKRGVEVE